MRERIRQIFEESVAVKMAALEANQEALVRSVEAIGDALKEGNKLLIFGNGGSAADSQHMAAEFVGRFQKERRALAAVALTVDTSALTALGNDYGFDTVFSRQVEALGRPGDVALGISTSGNSANVVRAVETARHRGLKTIVMTGEGGGVLAEKAEIALQVPSRVTARVQESHICLMHCICELVEAGLS